MTTLLKDITLRAVITMTMAKVPEQESLYVGTIVFAKDGKRYSFDFNSHTTAISGKTITIDCKDENKEDRDIPDDTVFEELDGAIVTDLFLQGDEDSYVDGQTVCDIELILYDATTYLHKVVFEKDAFRKADLGEYYNIKS